MDSLFAKIVYSANLTHTLPENAHAVEFFKQLRPGWVIPTRYKLSNPLLNSEYNDLRIKVLDKIQSAYSVCMLADGWSNVRRDSIINIVLTIPEAVFYKSIDSKANRHTAEYIGRQLIDTMNEIGPMKFFCIVTDNASNMRAAWRLVEKEFPHILTYGCIAHGINLLCQDIWKIGLFTECIGQCKEIVKEIRNCHFLLALFREKQKEKKISVALKLPVPTRWNSNFFCLQTVKSKLLCGL